MFENFHMYFSQPQGQANNASMQSSGAPSAGTQAKSSAPSQSFSPLQMPLYSQGPSSTNVYTQFGNFPNLQAFQNQQDAFVQQHLQNQAGYNAGLMSGQDTQRVPLMDAWKQAGDNIASGVYQGNPLATGNMAGLANLFSQYGMTMQPGFQDQLMQMIGQQSAPSLYSGAFTPIGSQPQQPLAAGDPRQQWRDAGMPGYDPAQPAFQVITDGWSNPNQSAAYQDWLRSQGQSSDMRGGPGGQPAPPPPAPQPAPERAPWQPPPAPAGGWRNDQQRRDAEYQSRIEYMMNPPPAAPPPPPAPQPVQPERPWSRPGSPVPPQGPYAPGPYFEGPDGELRLGTPEEAAALTSPTRGSHRPYKPGDYLPPVGQDPAYQEWRRGIVTDARARDPVERAAQESRLYEQYLREQQRQQQPPPSSPGYGGAIGVPVDQRRFNDIIDRDGDGVDDRFQPGPGRPSPEWSKPITDSWRPQQPPAFAPPGAARPIPPSGQGTPYEPPPPLRAQPGTSGPGWRESEGVRIHDPYTDPRGTGPVGAVGPNHLRPGVIRNPITGQEQYDPFTDPIGTGGGPATPHNAPIGNTWGTGRPVPPPIRRDPILSPQPMPKLPPMRPRPGGNLYLG